MVECYGYIGALEALDACVKSANVELVGCEFIGGGFVTILVSGDVGAVKASIHAAEAAVKKVGKLMATHVIARPSEEVQKILPYVRHEKEKVLEDKAIVQHAQQEETIYPNSVADERVEESKAVNKISRDLTAKTIEELKGMKTIVLRSLARTLDDAYKAEFPIERNQIKYSNKQELIDAILEYYERVR